MPEVVNFKDDVAGNVGNFEPLPEDRYHLILEKAVPGESKLKQTPQIAVTFKVVNGIETGEKYKNRKIFHNFTWTSKAMPFIGLYLKTIKSDIMGKTAVTIEEAAAALVDSQVSAFCEVVITDKSKGNKLSQWKEIENPVAHTVTPPSPQAHNGSSDPLFS